MGGLGGKGDGIKQRKEKPHRNRQQHGDYQKKRAGGVEVEESKGEEIVREGDLTWGGEHTIQHTDDIL